MVDSAPLPPQTRPAMSHFYLDIHEHRIREVAGRLVNEIAAERVPLRAEAAVTKEPVP